HPVRELAQRLARKLGQQADAAELVLADRHWDMVPGMGFLDGWPHCPRCSAELTRREECVDGAACGFVAYAKPVPAACPLVDDGGGVPPRRAWEPYAGVWDIPGG